MAHRPDPGRARGAGARGPRGVRREHSSAQRTERRHPVRRRNLYVRPVAADSQRPARTAGQQAGLHDHRRFVWEELLRIVAVVAADRVRSQLVFGPAFERRDVRGRGNDPVPAREARLRRRAGTRGARHAAVPAVVVLLVDLPAEGVDVFPDDCALDCRNRVVPRARLVAAALGRGDSAGRQLVAALRSPAWRVAAHERRPAAGRRRLVDPADAPPTSRRRRGDHRRRDCDRHDRRWPRRASSTR